MISNWHIFEFKIQNKVDSDLLIQLQSKALMVIFVFLLIAVNLSPALSASIDEVNASITGYSLTSDSYDRKSPSLPLGGTINWERLKSQGSTKFSPRQSHATCVFHCPHKRDKKCIWLTGGRTDSYRTFDLQIEDRTADVWWSEDGSTWNKVMELKGDFIDMVGNFDAKYGGEVAPWYSRYGHSLDVLDTNGDDVEDIMVLIGGYEPVESNDVWISPNGTTWLFAGHAPWPARAYHATAVFLGKLWIIGGTPLTNDVWSGTFIPDSTKRCGYRIRWVMEVANGDAPFAPRCAMCAVTQVRKELMPTVEYENENETISVDTEYIYVIGGFAGWPLEDERWNGDRTRNDVWRSADGRKWELIMPPAGQTTMPFVGRAWHACHTWHDPSDKSRGVRRPLVNDEANEMPAKILLSGGGYLGSKGNHAVYTLEGYVDMYWSYDGSTWHRINYEEGKEESLYSTNEWTSTLIGGKYVHRGKWGHSLESLPIDQDLDLDGSIANDTVALEFCSGSQEDIVKCTVGVANESGVPSLFLIGGDTTEDGPLVNDVFISRPGIMCEINGITCSGQGSCGPGTMGCICDSREIIGEYCDRKDENYTSSAIQCYQQPWIAAMLALSVASLLELILQ